MIREEDEQKVREHYRNFCSAWNITYPLHSFDIRQSKKNFSWVRSLSKENTERFMCDLTSLIVDNPLVGQACVIDRQGYNKRYREKYGRQTWMLCQTAFAVICERAAKFARSEDRKLRVYVEVSDKKTDGRIRKYYDELRVTGTPFAKDTSGKYGPLTADDLKDTLYELSFKQKSSPMAQLADLYLYPIARGAYQSEYIPYTILREHKKLADDVLDEKLIESMGIKYSCFENVGKP